MTSTSAPHPYAVLLRQRATDLRQLAAEIERSSVMGLLDLADEAATAGWTGSRADLCDRMLAGDIHRLHSAAEQLRNTAFGFATRAAHLEASRALPGVA